MEKKISMYTYAQWRHAIRCSMAIDNISYLYEEFSSPDATPIFIRGQCLECLKHWLALGRENDYVLWEELKRNHRPIEAVKIMELFHWVSLEDARNPRTYEYLIEGLNNDSLSIRILSHSTLFYLVPAAIPTTRSPPPGSRSPRCVRGRN